ETHHDDRGIIFPESVAPYDVHLIRLGKTEEARTAAEALYEKLPRVLYDERDESAGVKFADADLIGLPIRITVSDKSLKAGGAEVKRRNSEAKEIVPLEKILPKVLEPSGE
ncbi:MAG: proline--tRNA ligase, partial [Chloroflexi bacterium]|nr:proline--tRNA ligase [Chloroflexota bacterium]